LSIVQGPFSVAPCQILMLRFATFALLYGTQEFVEARGGAVRLNAAVQRIELNADHSVHGLRLKGGELVQADVYVSAAPVDIMKLMRPKEWSRMPFFAQLDELEGIPVINVHLWFDRKLTTPDSLVFSRSPLLSVYADMSTTCKEYHSDTQSMLELVFAPCSELAGSDRNWIGASDDEVSVTGWGDRASE
jgi:15-cis-phytoene desaturase